LRASDSGRLCGPKAANLAQLKHLFPNKVVEGIAIPFGIFRQHLDQNMPGGALTYWQFLQETFSQQARAGKNGPEFESYALARLAQLRAAIQKIVLRPGFLEELRAGFLRTFAAPIGQTPVFIRSDTNMEDLKDFTGAGLNLTVFNVVPEDRILQAIRDVWASPYTERSYRWRQKYLLNPENVYPSILVLPSVPVDKSGVMITTDVSTSEPEDVTVVFNRGAGGAVEGQSAEGYLLRQDGVNLLLSPSREVEYTNLPRTGGVQKVQAHFDQAILTPADLSRLRETAAEIKQKLPGTPGIETDGPFDVELGFRNDQIVLFQVRPFVENKLARSSLYLRSMDPETPKGMRVSLTDKLTRLMQ
jgi:hypothetical protein